MEKKFDLGNILQPNVELHQAEKEEPNGLELTQNQKTAFLTELKALLEKYDARFGDYEGYSVWFQIGNVCVS